MEEKSLNPQHRFNLNSTWYTEELGARVVAQSGIPTDRLHLGKLVFQSLKENPDLVAQIDGAIDKSETAGSVLVRSVRCAISMKNLGLKKGDVMVLLAPNHLDLIITVYAAMYQGIIIAGTDMTLGARELEASFKTSKPSIVFCQSDKGSDVETALKGSNTNAHIVTFDEGGRFQTFAEFLQKNSNDKVKVDDFKPTDFDPEETVLTLIATSGTTGLPKSAVMTHKNLATSLPLCMSNFFKFPTPTERYLLVSPSQWGSATVLYITSALYKFTRLQTSAPVTRDHLYDLINKYRPTTLMGSPTLMLNLLEEEKQAQCDFTCFEAFVLGGSFISEALIDSIKKVAPNAQLDLIYGMSESGGLGMLYDSGCPKNSLGKLAPLFQYRFVDPDTLEDVTEPNVVGELWYKGPSVFKGYYNNPEATKEAFTDGWLRSGDLLRKDENNYYFYVDRLKMLLKYKNNQISPIEVEEVIRQHPGVHDAAVVGVPDAKCGDLPAAFVVPRAGHKVTAQEIKNIVKENLAEYKQLAGGVIFLKAMPLTPTNKVDRRKLKEMVVEMERE